MPNQTIDYQLIIRDASTPSNPNGTANAIEITSVRNGTNPYLAVEPSGDGWEVDVITGAVRTGAYALRVVDASTGTDGTGTIRFLTNQLVDNTNRQQLLSRRAYINKRIDGGAWTQMVAGYVSSIRLINAIEYEIQVSDTRRIEQNTRIFRGNSLGSFTTRGCLTGGPVTAAFGDVTSGGINFRGGWKYRVSSVPGSQYVSLSFVSGYDSWVGSPSVTDWRQLKRDAVVNELQRSESIVTADGDWGFADAVLFVGTTTTNATATTHKLLRHPNQPPYNVGGTWYNYGYNLLLVYWSGAVPANGSFVYVSIYTNSVTELCPLYVDAHPIDIVLQVWSEAGIAYKNPGDPDPAWIASLRSLIGDNQRIALRLVEPPIIADFLDNAVFGPFGVSMRINSTTGFYELFDTRGRSDTTPSITITAADLTNGDDIIFDLDERTAISLVTLNQQAFAPVWRQPEGQQSPVIDGVKTQGIRIEGENLDTSVFGGRSVAFSIPGMAHTADNFAPNQTALLTSIAQPIFTRFGRGAQAADVSVLATSSAAALQVGDECLMAAPHLPNAKYRVGESSVGGRIMQVVRRTETPTGPQLRLMDVGDNQPTSPAPVVSVRKAPGQPAYAAQFELVNVTALASAFVSVEVEWKVSATTPTTGGSTFAEYNYSEIPVGWVTLPAVTPTSRVWVRARSKQYQKRSSAWTAWVDVTLDALTTLGAVSTSAVTASSVTLSWTNTDDTQSVFVYLYQGATAPASWTTYQIAELVPGSTTTTIRTGISSGLQYVAAIAYSTPVGPSAFQTATFTATGTGATLTRPAGLAIIPGSVDAALPRGVVVALYPSNSAADIAVYRAPDVSGSPGTFALLDVVTGTDSVYVDSSVTDGATYWYALTHRLGGFTESAQTPSVQASVSGVPVNVVRPPAVAPTITPATTGTSTDVELTIAVTDPQKRVALVEFRTSNAGAPFSAWTADTSVPYSASVAKGTSLSPSSIQWRVYGFTNEGTYTELRSGESKWPLNVGTNPTINRLTRSGYNASTGRYEVWGRYFYNVGDGTYLEDPILGFLTIFTCINVKNQAGTSAVVTDHTPKEADGWRFSWPSSSTDQWTFELTSYGLAETLIFPGQDSDQQIEPLPTIQGSATFIAPSGQSTSGTEPWVSELIEVVWDAPGAETSNAIDVQGRCYDLYSAPFASNTAYVTCVVTDGAADFEPSNTATITSGGVGTMVAGSGTATGVFKTDASGYFKIRVTETAAANRFIWVRGGGHQQVYIKARDGILQLTFA